MVRITSILARVPVIKFRKGGGGGAATPAGAPAAPAAAAAPQAATQAQPSAAMSTGPISDIDLPARYRRLPLSQEEIDHINGGGVMNGQQTMPTEATSGFMVPRAIMLQYGKKGDVIVFKMLLQKVEKTGK
ncbi:unnamed protein product [Leptosia nina]|uniref:Uncharacterized protein n=1 Tax=Leptosia nina TaxID=320188 RepID=A0AAV1JPM1_9NEOP